MFTSSQLKHHVPMPFLGVKNRFHGCSITSVTSGIGSDSLAKGVSMASSVSPYILSYFVFGSITIIIINYNQ